MLCYNLMRSQVNWFDWRLKLGEVSSSQKIIAWMKCGGFPRFRGGSIFLVPKETKCDTKQALKRFNDDPFPYRTLIMKPSFHSFVVVFVSNIFFCFCRQISISIIFNSKLINIPTASKLNYMLCKMSLNPDSSTWHLLVLLFLPYTIHNLKCMNMM